MVLKPKRFCCSQCAVPTTRSLNDSEREAHRVILEVDILRAPLCAQVPRLYQRRAPTEAAGMCNLPAVAEIPA